MHSPAIVGPKKQLPTVSNNPADLNHTVALADIRSFISSNRLRHALDISSIYRLFILNEFISNKLGTHSKR